MRYESGVNSHVQPRQSEYLSRISCFYHTHFWEVCQGTALCLSVCCRTACMLWMLALTIRLTWSRITLEESLKEIASVKLDRPVGDCFDCVNWWGRHEPLWVVLTWLSVEKISWILIMHSSYFVLHCGRQSLYHVAPRDLPQVTLVASAFTCWTILPAQGKISYFTDSLEKPMTF